MASLSASHNESTLPSSGKPAAAHSTEALLGASVANSPLFKLPPELRNRIYGYVFGTSKVIIPRLNCRNKAPLANRWGLRDYDDDENDDFYGKNQGVAVQTLHSVCLPSRES
jgi:hypothetical protein